jgi:hypothetical protein
MIAPLTLRMARASNPQGTAAMWARERLDELFTDEQSADWYPVDGRRGLQPAQPAMVALPQYAENLTCLDQTDEHSGGTGRSSAGAKTRPVRCS